jgi:hypothetical protein
MLFSFVTPSGFYGGQVVASMVGLDKVGSMHILRLYPFVIAVRKAPPLDQILQLLSSSDSSVGENPLYLLFFFSIDYVWWRSGEVGTMGLGLVVWGEKGSMKHVVYLPRHRECQPVDDWRDYFCDTKGTIPLWVYLGHLVWQFQVRGLQPDLVPYLVPGQHGWRVIGYAVEGIDRSFPPVNH